MEYSDHDFVSCFTGSGWRIHDRFSFHDGVYLLPVVRVGVGCCGSQCAGLTVTDARANSGGWITDNLDWRWLFYINILPGIYLVLSIPFLVNFDKPDLSLLKVADYPSIILLAMTLGCLNILLKKERWGWLDDNIILLTSVLALVSFILFAARTLTISNPIMDLHAFKDKKFHAGMFFSFSGGLGYSTVYLIPCVFGAGSRIKCRRDRFCRLHNRYFPVIFCSLYFWLSKNKSAMAVDGGAGWICVFNVSFTPITHGMGMAGVTVSTGN